MTNQPTNPQVHDNRIDHWVSLGLRTSEIMALLDDATPPEVETAEGSSTRRPGWHWILLGLVVVAVLTVGGIFVGSGMWRGWLPSSNRIANITFFPQEIEATVGGNATTQEVKLQVFDMDNQTVAGAEIEVELQRGNNRDGSLRPLTKLSAGGNGEGLVVKLTANETGQAWFTYDNPSAGDVIIIKAGEVTATLPVIPRVAANIPIPEELPEAPIADETPPEELPPTQSPNLSFEARAPLSQGKEIDSVAPGDPITYRFTIRNTGPGMAQDVKLLCRKISWGTWTGGNMEEMDEGYLVTWLDLPAERSREADFTIEIDHDTPLGTPLVSDCTLTAANVEDQQPTSLPHVTVIEPQSDTQLVIEPDDIETGVDMTETVLVRLSTVDGGQPLSGQNVTLSVDPPERGSVEPDEGVTDNNGEIANIVFTAKEVGEVDIIAMVADQRIERRVKLQILPSAITTNTKEMSKRVGPGTSYEKLGKISGNASIQFVILGRDSSNTWWQLLNENGDPFWLHSDFVDVKGNTSDVPDTTPQSEEPAPEPTPTDNPTSETAEDGYPEPGKYTIAPNGSLIPFYRIAAGADSVILFELPPDHAVEVLEKDEVSPLAEEGIVLVRVEFWVKEDHVKEGTGFWRLVNETALTDQICWAFPETDTSTCGLLKPQIGEVMGPGRVLEEKNEWRRVKFNAWIAIENIGDKMP